MNTAGVVLDFYDDVSGSLVKKAKAGMDRPGDLADTLGDFHFLTPDERDVLRDEAYALVVHNEGKVLRKFACVDSGNTVLSVLYFMENWDKLPTEAVKTAAANLQEWCGEYGLPVPSLVKMAAVSGMSRSRDPVRQPVVGEDADWAQRTNLVSIRGGADSGRVIPTASQLKTAGVEGGGMVLTTDKRDVGVHEKLPKLNVNDNVSLDSLYRGKKAKAPLDVSGKAPEVQVKRSSANLTALAGKYPLDAMADVEKAVEYFDENYKSMDPVDAHIFAVKTASRARDLGIEVSDALSRYGSTTYARDVDAHLANRLAVCAPEHADLYEELREKRASMQPIEFASLLSEADEVTGLKWSWGGEVADPFFSTFGEKRASSWSWQSRTGDFIGEDDLKWLARNGRPLVHKHFSSEISSAFAQDPIAIFESLPDDSKTILARLAADRFDSLGTN